MLHDRSRPESATMQSLENAPADSTPDHVSAGGAYESGDRVTLDGSASGRPRRPCLTEDDVLSYASGATSESWREQLHDHLDECENCRLLVQSTIAEDAHEVGPAPASVSEALVENVFTTFSPGKCIAERYRIESFIGKGGMGEVYCAFDQLLRKRVALKTVLCTAGDDPRAVRKLIDEVRHAEAITHPNVCRIQALLEHREPNGTRPPVPFFTMEFIEGETLAVRCRRGLLDLPLIRSIARQLLEGLKAAHAKGVRHLDFKSDNVMLRQGSQVEAIVMDFGLSRDRETRSRTSEHRGWMGTLPYMALEQLEGRPNLGPSVDIYAFGVVLYEMLTGQLPFQGASPSALIVKQMRERPPAPSSLRSNLSPDVDAFVCKCLRRSAKERYGDAALALEAFDGIRSWERRAVVPLRGARHAVALAGIAVVFSGIAIVGTRQTTPPTTSAELGRVAGSTSAARGNPPTEVTVAAVPPAVASELPPQAESASSKEESAAPAPSDPVLKAAPPAPRSAGKRPTTALEPPAPVPSAPTLPRALKHVPRRPLALRASAAGAGDPKDASSERRAVGETGQAPAPK